MKGLKFAYRIGVLYVLVKRLTDTHNVRVGATQDPLPIPLPQEDGVASSNLPPLLGQLVEVRDNGDLVRHRDGGAVEFRVGDGGEEVRHIGRGEGELGPFEAEVVVDCLVHERGEGVGDGVAEEVGDALEVRGVGGWAACHCVV